MTEGVPQAPALGDRLGGYVLKKVVHEGRTGTLYEARSELGAPVDIKLLHGTFAEDEVARGRLEREALAGVLAEHPNCVSVLDLKGLPDGRMFLVLEHVDGERLSELIARDGALDTDRALDITKQVLAGLAHAHAADIVHRGIEPANIVLSQGEDDGEVARLMNFGIAKLEGSAGAGQQELTRAGQTLGNPRYSAPEVLSSGQASKSADLYSVAAMLFELLTGKLPFDHDDPVKALQAVTSAPPPAFSKVAPDRNIPKAVETLVRRGLSKAPADRFDSADDLLAAIDAALAGDGAEDDEDDADTVLSADKSDGVVAAAMPASANKTMALGSLQPMVAPGQRKTGTASSSGSKVSATNAKAAGPAPSKATSTNAPGSKSKPGATRGSLPGVKPPAGPLPSVRKPAEPRAAAPEPSALAPEPPAPTATPPAPSAPAATPPAPSAPVATPPAPSAPAPAATPPAPSAPPATPSPAATPPAPSAPAPAATPPAAPSAAPSAPRAQPMTSPAQQPMAWPHSRPAGFRAWFAELQRSPKFPWIMLGIFVFLVAAFTALFQATN